jgi:hypothetical protein
LHDCGRFSIAQLPSHLLRKHPSFAQDLIVRLQY